MSVPAIKAPLRRDGCSSASSAIARIELLRYNGTSGALGADAGGAASMITATICTLAGGQPGSVGGSAAIRGADGSASEHRDEHVPHGDGHGDLVAGGEPGGERRPRKRGRTRAGRDWGASGGWHGDGSRG
jgi:hypothetical protein